MPYREIESTWNIRSVNDNDFDQGVASAHEKWWDYPVSGNEKLHDHFMRVLSGISRRQYVLSHGLAQITH